MNAKFEVLTTVLLKIQVFWDVTSCRWLSGFQIRNFHHRQHFTQHLFHFRFNSAVSNPDDIAINNIIVCKRSFEKNVKGWGSSNACNSKILPRPISSD
jgi:hypothetical protein